MTGVGTSQIRQQATEDGAILFDAGLAAQGGQFDPAWFEPEFWRGQDRAIAASGGRGGITFAHTPDGDWALRHYRRGGFVARVMGDRYLWSGGDNTRSFAEFRLLHGLARRGMAVSRPVAARYRRSGTHYRADLITLFIPDAHTFAYAAQNDGVDAAVAARVGIAVASLHAAGVYHADLNAHNVLIDANRVWVIDFDRGELRSPQRTWQQANLSRLRRSLIKLGAAKTGQTRFDRDIWLPLMSSYERALGDPAHIDAVQSHS